MSYKPSVTTIEHRTVIYRPMNDPVIGIGSVTELENYRGEKIEIRTDSDGTFVITAKDGSAVRFDNNPEEYIIYDQD